MRSVVLITGISGSGKSVALRMLEDLHYNCVDNLPISLLHEYIAEAQNHQLSHIAVAIDIRSHGDISNLPDMISGLRARGIPLQAVFLEARTETLLHRYSESRRAHPLTEKIRQEKGHTPSLEESIAYEKELLSPLRQTEHVIDTSDIAPSQLRAWIKDLCATTPSNILLTFESFAFKQGVPSSADLVFDVRCLPNPHYDPTLRSLTGRDEAVAKWLSEYDSVAALIDDITTFVQKWLPLYSQDTRNYLTIAIGCTGGKHRSVYVAEQLAKRFSHHAPLRVRHRAQIQLYSNFI